MTDLAPYVENQALRHFFRGNVGADAAERPSEYRMSVHDGNPGPNGASNEASGGSYERQSIAFNAPTGSSPTTVPSGGEVAFPGMPAGEWTHGFLWGLVDTDWQPLGRLTLATPRTTQAGDTLRFPAGDVTFALD